MKYAARFLLIFMALAFGGSLAHAQQTGASYEKGLKMVREAKYQAAMAEFLPLAQAGHAPSQFSVGLMYHLGRGVPKSLKTAYEWYKKAVLQEHVPSLNNVGMMYLNGEFVARNRDVAFELFKKASAQHAQAKDNVAQCYENAWGTERDIQKAIEFYTLSGESGYIAGFHHLGQLYEKDYPGFPKNIDKAVEFYIKAAEMKYGRARTRLFELKRLPDRLKN